MSVILMVEISILKKLESFCQKLRMTEMTFDSIRKGTSFGM